MYSSTQITIDLHQDDDGKVSTHVQLHGDVQQFENILAAMNIEQDLAKLVQKVIKIALN